jgi:hypothetical protein
MRTLLIIISLMGLVEAARAEPSWSFAAIAMGGKDIVAISINQPTMDKAKSDAMSNCNQTATQKGTLGCKIVGTYSIPQAAAATIVLTEKPK